MNFIREILAERTKMAGAADNQTYKDETAGPADLDDLAEEIDLVHKVASGGLSLSRADQFAYHDDGQMTEPEDSQETGDLPCEAGHLDTATEAEEKEEFGLLNDPSDATDPAETINGDAAAEQQPSELFADLWDGDNSDDETSEKDFFAGTAPQHDVNEPADTLSGSADPETNTQALMRTIYPTDPQTTSDAVAEDPPPSDQPEATQPQEQAPAISAFQRIKRRQAALPPESDTASDPTVDVAPEVIPEPIAPIAVPAPAAGRARRQAGRVKTRLLGFGNEPGTNADPFAADGNTEPATQTMFPVGWMVVVSGPGRGTAFTLLRGVSQIGRGEGQAVRLDFGDNSISRENHAAIAYDPEQQAFFLGHGGKTNLVRLNGMPVLSTEPLNSGALIRIGETTLRFVGLCGTDFDWDKSQDGEDDNARLG